MPSLRKNFAYNLAYQVLAFAVPLVTAPYLSRVLGAEGIGQYSYGYNTVYYLSLLAQLGLSRYGTREIAARRVVKEGVEGLFWELFWMQFSLTCVVGGGYALYAFVFSDNALAPLWVPFLISYGLDLTWLYNGEENFRITVMRNSLVKVTMFVGVLLFVRSPDDVWVYVTISSVGQLLSQLVALPYARAYIAEIRLPAPRRCFAHLLPSVVLFIPTIATSVYRTLDKVLLGAVCSSEQLGYFDSSEKIIMVPLGVISALSAVMLPRVTSLLTKGAFERSHEFIRATMLLSCFLSLGMCGGIISVAPDFVPLYFGETFLPCIVIIEMLALTVPFIAWACVVREQYLIPATRYREYIISVVAGAVCNVALNAILMPSFGACGTGVSMVVTEVLVCVLISKHVFVELGLYESLCDALPFCVPAILMVFASSFASSFVSGTLASFAVRFFAAAFVYLALSLVLCRRMRRLRPLIRILGGERLCRLLRLI